MRTSVAHALGARIGGGTNMNNSVARTADYSKKQFRKFIAKIGPTKDEFTGVIEMPITARSSLEAGRILEQIYTRNGGSTYYKWVAHSLEEVNKPERKSLQSVTA